MNPRNLGKSGLMVAPLCLGMMSYGSPSWAPWVLDKGEASRFVGLALDHGLNFFDTADFYSYGASEEGLGAALAGVPRGEVVLSSKVGVPMNGKPTMRGNSRKHLRDAIEATLRRLKTDYLDLYLLHVWDDTTPIGETIDALERLVDQGKILYYGASNFRSWQLSHAQQQALLAGGRGFTAMQLQYNLVCRDDERDTLPLCGIEGIGVMVYSPLARGWLVGGDTDVARLTERERARVEKDVKSQAIYGSAADRQVRACLLQLARERDVPPGRIALAWLLARPHVSTIIVGALEPHHLREAVAALDLTLTAAELQLLDAAYVPGGSAGIGGVRAGGYKELLAQQQQLATQGSN